ncbi:MAG: hypothetical protein NTY98_09135 [Verrucomicrobia bacterium]|nr:hypothetical protein [Verrucomicrobiota bacterium]
MTSTQLIQALEKLPHATLSYGFAFPYVQIGVQSHLFIPLEIEDREILVAEWINTDVSTIRKTANEGLLTLHWLTPDEKLPFSNRGDHWLYGRIRKPENLEVQPGPLTRHFFGYKGGQARSTVMSLIARTLADNGLKVLMIDADLEAPTLVQLWNKAATRSASTLLGLYKNNDFEPIPIPCHTSICKKGGRADLIAARLADRDYDWDYDAFTVKALLDPTITISLGKRLIRFASEKQYDAVLVDQRTGASPATLNWYNALPGSCCVFARLDDQWESGIRFYKTLFDISHEANHAIVSFKPDDENPETFRSRNAKEIQQLNDILTQATLSKIAPAEDADDVDIERWTMWPYDQSFRTSRLPASHDLGISTKDTLDRLIGLLELSPPPPSPPQPLNPPDALPKYSLSGNTDQDYLIQTPVLRDLLTKNNSVGYIFGRKGTGKSRLFRTLAERQAGLPVVADLDFPGQVGLRSGDIRELSNSYENAEDFWWALLNAALETSCQRDQLRSALLKSSRSPAKASFRSRLTREIDRKVFLLDGLETAFTGSQIQGYITALFEVMRILQTDSDFRELVEVKLFLRADLKPSGSVQNLEQQLEGRSRFLSWDLQSILNFMLSRVASLDYFQSTFPTVTDSIIERIGDLKAGQVSTEDSFNLLLPIFPTKVTRVNATMRTFFTLHFADSVNGEERYYPRFIQHFLKCIDETGRLQSGTETPFRDNPVKDGRISSALVQHAHDQASKQFLEEVRQEMNFLLDLPAGKIEQLLAGFSGQQTPFNIDSMVNRLQGYLGLSEDEVKKVMERLMSLGIFELRPRSDSEEWRVGRLFKAALKMKLRRSPS